MSRSNAAPPPACLLLAEETWGGALHAIRSLGSSGVQTYVATTGSRTAVYGRSRYCSGATAIPPDDPRDFCRMVVSWAKRVVPRNREVVVLALSDRLVDFLNQSRDLFPTRFRLGVPPPDVISRLLDKPAAFAIAEQAGLDVPRWCTVAGLEDVARVDRLKLPVIVRPTAWSTAGEEYFKLVVCRDHDLLHHTLRERLATGARLVVQEYVAGPDREVQFGIAWRSADRTSTAVCTGRKCRESTADGGVMLWGETTPLPLIHDWTRAFLDASRFTGLGGIEFVKSRGRVWFVEFNPRLEATHFVAKRAGVDTVLLAYADLAFGIVPRHIPEQRHAAAWMGNAWLARLMENPRDLPTAVRDRVAFASTPRRITALWSWRDPGPAVALTQMFGIRASESLLLRRSPRTSQEVLG